MKPTDSIRLTTSLLFFFVVFLSVAVQTPAQERIRIGISSSSPGFLPTVVAEQKGFFTKYGLASEHIRISLSVAMNALSTGDLDYAITMAQGIAGAIRGVPVKLLMMTQDKLVFFLMTRPGIQQVTDLRGQQRIPARLDVEPLTERLNPRNLKLYPVNISIERLDPQGFRNFFGVRD